MDNFFNTKNLIDIGLKWKFQLVVVVLAALLLSALFSSSIFITPLYKSNCLIYPSNISPYSDESVTEQSVQIFQSRDIRDSLVKKFNLAKHWKLDSNFKHFESSLVLEYSRRVTIDKTPYDAVAIEIWDQDPVMARDLVLGILGVYNTKIKAMHREKYGEVLANFKYILDVKKGYLDSLKARSRELGDKYGLLEYPSQTREVMRAYFNNDGSSVRSSEAKTMKKNMEENGGEMLTLVEMLRSESYAYTNMKADVDRALLNYNRDYTYVNVLSSPFIADQKSYPVRWLIMAFSTMAAFFMAILIIGIIEQIKFRSLSNRENEG